MILSGNYRNCSSPVKMVDNQLHLMKGEAEKQHKLQRCDCHTKEKIYTHTHPQTLQDFQ